MKKLFAVILSLLSVSVSANAAIIYEDNFDGDAGTPLNGLVPDIAPEGVTWFAGANFAANGYGTYDNIVYGDTAYLPITLESGNIYILTVDIDCVNTGNKWAGVGFTVNTNTDAANRFMEDGLYYWALTRGATEYDQCFGGVRTNNGIVSTTTGADNITITVDTTEPSWVITWGFDGAFTTSFTTASPATDVRYVAFTSNSCDIDIDYFKLEMLAGKPSNPVPADGSDNVDENVSFSWDDIEVPAIDPNVSSYTLNYAIYDASEAPAEPNLVGAVAVTGLGNSYGPLAVGKDKVVFWNVDAVLDYDNQIISSDIWTLATLTTSPIITSAPVDLVRFPASDDSLYPDSGIAHYEGDAIFTCDFNCYSSVASVVWTDPSDTVIASGFTQDGTLYSASLTISDIAPADQGTYTCTVTTTAGLTASASADLLVRGQISAFTFDTDLSDSISGATAALTSGAADITDGALVLDGTQAVDLGTNGYPSAGFGNGLESGTVSIWTTINGIVEGQANVMLMGVVNGLYYDDNSYDLVDAFQLWTVGNTVNARIRGNSGSSVQASATLPASIIGDGKCHMVTVAYARGSSMQLYVDGAAVGSAVNYPAALEFNSWDYSLLLGANNDRTKGANGFLDGSVADLKVFNYPLDKFEVVDLYIEVETDASFCLLPIDETYDFVDDCEVNILDFAVFASKWLDCGYYPQSTCN